MSMLGVIIDSNHFTVLKILGKKVGDANADWLKNLILSTSGME